ncbi:MAG: acyltransferase [Coriobacteriia bacterium]|nr:acyltransferase [Coriobacteriia bacterium]MBN2840210.1 acyltransferase [Coriobacteriia bacterium]
MALRGLVLALRSRSFVAPVFVGRGVVVTDAARLRLSPGVTIGDYCRLDCTGRLGISLGRGVTLRRGTHIEVTSVLRQVAEGCVLADRVGVSEGCFIGAKGLVRIGEDTIIGPHAVIVAENHVFTDPEVPVRQQGVTREGIEIGRDCWIGGGAKVLDGVRVGDHAVIGAGAVVTHDVAPLAVAVGVPARVVQHRGADTTG